MTTQTNGDTDPQQPAPPDLAVAAGVEPAELQRGECAIRAVTPGDYDWIVNALFMDPVNLMTYRFGGIPPNPESLSTLLWGGVAAQFLITAAHNPNQRFGLVTFYARNDHAQHSGFAVAMSAEARRVAWPWRGVGVAIDHYLRVTRTNKLWVEIPGWNMGLVRGIRLLGFVEEGRQVQHEWLDGRYWDRYLYATFRNRWEQTRPLRLQGLG